jgi:3-hydroxyisobutyrate dehydrogenase
MKKRAQKWNTLDAVLEEAWTLLQSGVKRPQDPFHRPVLGTTAKEGSCLRTVILRGFDLNRRLLVCHTDARALKVGEIAAFANVSWLFYHPERKVQLRISGNATLHADDQFADEQWAATKVTSRLNYCAVEPPGTAIARPSTGLPDFLRHKAPTLLDSERGRCNFMVIACQFDSLDWVGLSTLGNRRARFVWDENGLTASWLVP